MPTIQEEQAARTQLTNTLTALLAYRDENLVRTSELGTQGDFSEASEDIKRLLDLYDSIHRSPLGVLVHAQLTQATSHAQAATELFKQIKEYRADQGTAQRSSLITQLRDLHNSHVVVLAPILAYAYAQGTDVRELERQVRETATAARQDADALRKDLENQRKVAEAIVSNIRDSAARVGVGHHAENFAKEAASHDAAALAWRGALILLSILAVVVLLALFVWPLAADPKDLTPGHAIYAVATRILVFSVVSYILLWTARNYMAHRHNVVINKHRQNSLTTFETFVNAGGDDRDVKNAILLQAAQCIFTQQPTGYLSKEPLPTPPRDLLGVIQKAVSPVRDEHA